MSVIVHGTPGQSLDEDGAARYGRDDARRGAFWEGVVGRALERWLRDLPGTFHLFHDLGGFSGVSGHGFGPMSLGRYNADHVVLTGAGCLLVNAKGCAAGMLALAPGDHGVLIRDNVAVRRVLWLEDRRDYSCVGILYRLTGLPSSVTWIVPDTTELHPSVKAAPCVRRTHGIVLPLRAIPDGYLAEEWPSLFESACPADPDHVAALQRYVTCPPPKVLSTDERRLP
jgi:hypothetical protein